MFSNFKHLSRKKALKILDKQYNTIDLYYNYEKRGQKLVPEAYMT